ncbi:hypothetical protein J4214_02050 [Candidatus Woesearchaeota archaeon]|nr:hypothetical protein [Candidatus Woesearchaeota archaeon]
MHKRGSFDTSMELGLLFPRLFIIGIVFIAVTMIIDTSLKMNTDVSEIESYTLKNRIFYSQSCILWKEHNRPIPGIIDIEKFNEQNLDTCLKNTLFGIKFTLNYENKTKEIELNKRIYQQQIFCFDKDQVYCENKDYYILVNEKGSIKDGILRIEMVRLKRDTL